MPFFRKPYQSEITQFIAVLKAEAPELEAAQREGRERLWDKPVDTQAQAEFRRARVAQQPYVYQTRVE